MVCDALAHAFERWDGRGFPGSGISSPLSQEVVDPNAELDALIETAISQSSPE